VLVPDNMSSVIDKANLTDPRSNQAFVEHAQARAGPGPGIFWSTRPGNDTAKRPPPTSNRDLVESLALRADGLLAQSAIDRLQSSAYELILDGDS